VFFFSPPECDVRPRTVSSRLSRVGKHERCNIRRRIVVRELISIRTVCVCVGFVREIRPLRGRSGATTHAQKPISRAGSLVSAHSRVRSNAFGVDFTERVRETRHDSFRCIRSDRISRYQAE